MIMITIRWQNTTSCRLRTGRQMKPLVTKNKYELISDSFEGDLPETPTEAARPLLSKAVVYVAGGSRHPYSTTVQSSDQASEDSQNMIDEYVLLPATKYVSCIIQ